MTEQQKAQQPQLQQIPFEPSPAVQAELTTLNVRYRDMQDTMSHLITLLATENAQLKTENTALKNQLSTLQAQDNAEIQKNKL